jgi:hypothetical protein
MVIIERNKLVTSLKQMIALDDADKSEVESHEAGNGDLG